MAVAQVAAPHAHAVAQAAGENAEYWRTVAGAGADTGTVRTHYIGADEVVWDYAPAGRDLVKDAPFDDVSEKYASAGAGRIGSRYVKCVYRAYADDSFKVLLTRPVASEYLGLFGPVIHAEVGDTIKVVFRNGCRIPTGVHPHGVFYTKANEGAPYSDGTAAGDKVDDSIPQGARYTYTWRVPERAGPGPHDGSSVMWMYHSHTEEVGDLYAGLMGPIVVTARGRARPDGTPKDVDQELFELFFVTNENLSPYLDANIHRFMKPPFAIPDKDDFAESNLKHSINGFLYANQPMVTLTIGSHVRWYIMAMGNEVDLHTPHWHGNTVLIGGMRMDVASLLPAGMLVADMVPDDPGVWLFHCHVSDHFSAGMITRYRVQ
jgi:hephaestin